MTLIVGFSELLEKRAREILSSANSVNKLDEVSQTSLFIIITLFRHLFAGFEHIKVHSII